MRRDAAQAELAQAISLNPGHVAPRLLRARLRLWGDRDYAGAREDLEAALLTSPRDRDVLATLAFVLLRLGDIRQASKRADAALVRGRTDPDAHWVRSLIRQEAGDMVGAERDLDAAVADPDHRRAWLARAKLHFDQGRFDKAAADAGHDLRTNPFDPESLSVRIVSRLALGDAAGSLSDLDSLIGPPGGPYRRPPDFPDVGRFTLQRVMMLVRLGRRDDALRDLAYLQDDGGPRIIMQMQIHLRHNGFPDVQLTGQRSPALDDALHACFLQEACGRAVNLRS